MTQAALRPLPPALSFDAAIFLLAAGAAAVAVWVLPQALNPQARLALAIAVLAMAGWAHPRLPATLVALGAGLALVLAGVVPEDRLFEMLGSELIWLLIAAFLIAGVIRDSGLALRLAQPVLAWRLPFAGLLAVLTLLIAATALVLPSTSGRAALLLPVCLALTAALPDPRLGRALALLFPTVILLSAGGSVLGAGAHLLAVEAIAGAGGPRLGYGDWLWIGGPLALLASFAGAGLILLVFVPRNLWAVRSAEAAPAGPATREQARIAAVVAGLPGLWLTEDLHGVGMALVALGGALLLLTPPFGRRKPKDMFRAVDLDLILFMAMAALLAEALMLTGADRWLADGLLSHLPMGPGTPAVVVLGALSGLAVLSHLWITSRSARAAILIPAVALPAAGLGHDPALLVLVVVMGTGFCQTLMVSAKPVAIFGQIEGAGFGPADLMRLALPLAPVMAVLVSVFALTVWPRQLAALRPPAALAADELPAAAAAPELPAATAANERPAAAVSLPGLTSGQRAALADLPPAPRNADPARLQGRAGDKAAGQALSRAEPAPAARPAKARRAGQGLRAVGAGALRDLRRIERQFLGLFR